MKRRIRLGRRGRRLAMKGVIRARCFEDEERTVQKAAVKLGVDDSEIVRKGAVALAERILHPKRDPRLIEQLALL